MNFNTTKRMLLTGAIALLGVAIYAEVAQALSPSSIVFIADSENNRIRAVNTSTGIITTVAGNGTGGFSGDGGPATRAMLKHPTGVDVDGSGNLYIADTQNNRIRMVSAATGIITTVAGNNSFGYNGDNIPATSATLWNPTGVSVTHYMLQTLQTILFIADESNNRIRLVNISCTSCESPTPDVGKIATYAGNGAPGFSGDGGPATSAQLYYPTGVAFDYTTKVLVIADSKNQRVRMVGTPGASNTTITTLAGTGNVGYNCNDNLNGAGTAVSLNNPFGLFAAFGTVFFADTGNQCVRGLSETPPTGIESHFGNGYASYGGDGGPATNPRVALNYPTGCAFDSTRAALYIADNVNHRIRATDGSTITTFAGNGTPGFSGDGGLASAAQLYNPTGVAVFPPLAN
jgi:hypothetical protein